MGAPQCTNLSFSPLRPSVPPLHFFLSMSVSLKDSLHSDPLPFSQPSSVLFLNALHFFHTAFCTLCGWWGETESLSEPSRSPGKHTHTHTHTYISMLYSRNRILLLPPLTAKQHPHSHAVILEVHLANKFEKKACLETSQKYTGHRTGYWELLSSNVICFIFTSQCCVWPGWLTISISRHIPKARPCLIYSNWLTVPLIPLRTGHSSVCTDCYCGFN